MGKFADRHAGHARHGALNRDRADDYNGSHTGRSGMLHLGRQSTRVCQGITRRELLQAGTCSALGLGLADVLGRRANAEAQMPAARSVLLLWLWGGPSHHETWDPKPDAPSQVRGCFRPIATATPGTQICELLPLLAQRTEQFTIVRSMHHDQKDHNVGGTIGLTGHVAGAKASGGIPFPGMVRPSMGSVVSYLGRSRAGDWPAFTCIGPVCKVSGEALRGQTASVLGAAHDPFRLDSYSFEEGVRLPPSLEPLAEIGARRLDDRRALLSQFDVWQRDFESAGDVERYGDLRAKAFGLMTSPAAKQALNLDAESESLRNRYGRTVFGQNCILARRLIEADVPFVQINWSGDAEDEQQGGDGGWDLHYRLFERMQERYCPIFDRAFSALLIDLQERGLLDTTLVLAMGEFGRSPQISSIGGREHWPWGYSVCLAGAGLPGGAVIGATTPDGGQPRTRPIHPANLHSTVLDKLGLDRLALGEREAAIVEPPIEELL